MSVGRVRVARLLEVLGVAAKCTGSRWVAPCPSPKHRDSDPSWSIIDRPGTAKHASHHCFGCGFGGGPWELAAAVWGVSSEQAGERLRGVLSGRDDAPVDHDTPRVRVVRPGALAPFALPGGVRVPSRDGSSWLPSALAYLRGRGVTDEQLARWGIGYATSGDLALRVVIPVRDCDGVLVTYVARAYVDAAGRPHMAGKLREGARSDRALFGEEHFDLSRDVAVVTEAAFKSLAFERVGAPNPCGTLGASNMGRDKWLKLARFKRLVWASDPDAAGDMSAAEARTVLGRRCDVVRLRLPRAPDDCSPEQLRAGLASVGLNPG